MAPRTMGADRWDSPDRAQIVLNLLESVERDGGQSQRHLASDLGIALGLVNVYLKRCIKKGLVKVRRAPARRYIYYLTPQGFSEKSRLTLDYLTSSFGFFRKAKIDCLDLLSRARSRGHSRVVLAGKSDLAEIMTICALDSGIEIIALVDSKLADPFFFGLPVRASFDAIDLPFDAVVVTDLLATAEIHNAATGRYGEDRVLIPNLLISRLSHRNGKRS